MDIHIEFNYKQDRIAGSALSAPESVQFCHITRFCYVNSEQILTYRFETFGFRQNIWKYIHVSSLIMRKIGPGKVGYLPLSSSNFAILRGFVTVTRTNINIFAKFWN